MHWKVKIHRLVIEEDFAKLDPSVKKRIIKSIHRKLSVDPQNYGENLRSPFHNYRKLKVGDYRVIYEVIKEEITVFVVKVGIRRDFEVYKELLKRLQ